MTARQVGILIVMFSAGAVVAGIARPGNWDTAIVSQPEPVMATVGLVAIVDRTAPAQSSIRVILASPYEAR